MTNFIWTIRQIEAQMINGLDNVIVTACFQIDADENGLKGWTQSDVKLLPVDAQSFIELPDVTQAQVVEWVKDALGVDGVARFENRVQAQIDMQKVEQPKVVPLPWL